MLNTCINICTYDIYEVLVTIIQYLKINCERKKEEIKSFYTVLDYFLKNSRNIHVPLYFTENIVRINKKINKLENKIRILNDCFNKKYIDKYEHNWLFHLLGEIHQTYPILGIENLDLT